MTVDAHPQNDLALAHARLQNLVDGNLPPGVVSFVHEGTPIPAERVRYNPKAKTFFKGSRSREAGADMLYAFRVALNRRRPLADTVAMVAIFYLADRRRKDTDNLLKLVMDAGTKARVWLDDSQVIAQAVFLELDRERPRTVVALCPCVGTLSKAPLLSGDLHV